MRLFVNACARQKSRTRRLAEIVLAEGKGEIREVNLAGAALPKVNEGLLKLRDDALRAGDFSLCAFDLAREFAAADEIIIAAPFWDFSFPATLKQYLEQISVPGIAFRYTREGAVVGLCRAKRLTYVTTAGGPILSDEYGYGYVRALALQLFGIPETRLIKAEGLDVAGADVVALLKQAARRYVASKR